MPFEKVEYEFPEDKTESKTEDIKEDVEEKPEEKEEASAEVAIEIVDDTPPEDRNRKPAQPPSEVTDDELEDYSERARKRIKHLSRGYHDERRKAEAALREKEEAIKYAQKIYEDNQKLKESYDKQQAVLVEQAKARASIELQQAERAYKSAYESGDSDQVVSATKKLNEAQNRLDKISNWKPASLQQAETTVKPEPTAPAPKVDPKAVAWQKQNPWFGSDEEMTSLALGLHQKLVKEGVDPQSDEYYDRINGRMRQLFPTSFEEEAPVEKPKRTTVVAPATRSVAPKKIVITESAARLAKRLGLTPEQYARQVAEDMRNQNG